ncbi:glycoside hydrolase family 2 protein [Ochrovirga pacifica]|uniref:glycoside hydrolase family 2 protein n=1 Tax=Ochrovirga pacifica TaxID=1042376 RepID=UPI00025597FA|nr:glycoside hydrolase family 2 TIM barrel-domain containing protein [Ochrovirga pacifica]
MVKFLRTSISILLLAITQVVLAQKSEFSKIKINNDWKFSKLEKNQSEAGFEKTTFNDLHWQQVSLPHTANIEPLVVNNQWQGICWYRKKLEVPALGAGKKVLLEFEAAMNASKIWINGMLVNKHQGGYLPVVVDVTDFVEKGRSNVIAVRLDNTDNLTTGPKPLKRLDFNMFGGLYRNAWMYIKDEVHISHAAIANKVAGGGIFVSYPKVKEEASLVKVKTHVVNSSKNKAIVEVKNTLFFKGKEIGSESKKINLEANKDTEQTTQIVVKNAKLWSPETPNLYTLQTQVYKNGTLVEMQEQRIGIRVFTFKGEQLYINGKKTFLRGVNRHQEYPFVGYAMSDNAQYRDAKKIKEGGFNYIRLSHYPHAPSFMDACDELGIVVIDAILGWQFYKDADDFRNYCYTSAKQLIRRDRNRPSVLAWEVSLNETKMPIFFMEELNKIVHEEYPGENVYSCGWMDDVYDIYLQARQHRILHPHALKEGQPYSVSEYGDWEYYSKNAGLNQDNLPNEMRDEYSSRQSRANGEERMLRQAYNVQEAHHDNLGTKAYSDSYWVMYDYNRGYHPDIEKSGLMDVFRLPKFAYDFYQSQRDVKDGRVLKIASYWNEKSPLAVKVYSNYDEVALYLNGELIAKQKPDRDKNATRLQHPPFTFQMKSFTPGTLKAVAYQQGKKAATTKVMTPQAPVALKVWLDESGRKAEAGVNDVLFLYVAAVDKNGTIVPDYSEKVSFKIEGDAKLMNVGTVKAEAGIATGVLKIGEKKKKIKIHVQSSQFSKKYSISL